VAIDYEGPVPVYVQLANFIRERINDGTYAVDRPIPSKKLLMQEFGIAASTVERALTVLREEGRIVTVMGRGLYVTPRSQWTG
jgi:DNA-binding GntR family transcriptional regulator